MMEASLRPPLEARSGGEQPITMQIFKDTFAALAREIKEAMQMPLLEQSTRSAGIEQQLNAYIAAADAREQQRFDQQQRLIEKQQQLIEKLQKQIDLMQTQIEKQQQQIVQLSSAPPLPPSQASPSTAQPNLLAFKVSADAHASLAGRELATAIANDIKESLSLTVAPQLKVARIIRAPMQRPAPMQDCMDTDAPADAPAPVRRVFAYVEVSSEIEAQEIRASRPNLRNSPTPSYAVRDWLTPAELSRHSLLFPLFKAARAAGQRARWSRAQLYIDGQEVHPPVAAAVAAA